MYTHRPTSIDCTCHPVGAGHPAASSSPLKRRLVFCIARMMSNAVGEPRRVALLVDADNVPPSSLMSVVLDCARCAKKLHPPLGH